MTEVRNMPHLWRGKVKFASWPSAWTVLGRWLPPLVCLYALGCATAALAVPATPAVTGPQLVRSMSFPNRPMRLIVPFPAGGVADAVARLLAERLSARLGV